MYNKPKFDQLIFPDKTKFSRLYNYFSISYEVVIVLSTLTITKLRPEITIDVRDLSKPFLRNHVHIHKKHICKIIYAFFASFRI